MKEFPKVICTLRNLKYLSLRENNIAVIPDEIADLSELDFLDLTGNKVKEIPEALFELTKLTELSVHWNCVERLPESIGRLSQLEKLSVGYNPIKSLPDSIGRLSQLGYLNVSNTPIENLPQSLAGLSKLLTIWIDDCEKLPAELTGLYARHAGSWQRRIRALRCWLRGEADPEVLRFPTVDSFDLPADLRAAVDADERPVFDFDEANNYAYPPFRLRGSNELHVDWLDVCGFDGEGGPWDLPVIRLFDSESDRPTDILMWLPEHHRYATFDAGHDNLFVFHERIQWSAMAADFPTYFFATNNGGCPDEEFAVYYEDSDCFTEP